MQRNIVKDLIKPRRLDIEDGQPRYGKFVAGPLERGYGTTIGNSLRRILLSSLPGAAITSVRIDGVKHEFSTVPGCIEDVTEIILNLKEVIIDIGDKDEVTLRLDAKGPVEVKASMIQGDPSVRVINPDHHIASLNTEGELHIELTAKVGRGYVVAESHKDESAPVGTIYLDAVYSPVRKVNHVVTNARVGQQTDFDKLTLEVWTDGSIGAEDAVRGAAYILRDQLSVFTGSEEMLDEVERSRDEETVTQVAGSGGARLNENLYRRIDELELSVRSSNCLENADIKYIGELVQRSEAEMLRTKNFGRKSLNEIKEILGEMGLGLGMKLDSFPPRHELDRISEASGGVPD
ncbi:MAG: DNA-directed RNA polymerase subunit alpha [Bdellovibrionales bacterium]|nr:DNA-directed RNA polymerase subunit alpha [Bdellovibrionales bacterium]